MRCNNCGSEFNDSNLKFCTKCGTPFPIEIAGGERTELFVNQSDNQEYEQTQLMFGEQGGNQVQYGNQGGNQVQYGNQGVNQTQYGNQGLNQTQYGVQGVNQTQYGTQNGTQIQYGMQQNVQEQYTNNNQQGNGDQPKKKLNPLIVIIPAVILIIAIIVGSLWYIRKYMTNEEPVETKEEVVVKEEPEDEAPNNSDFSNNRMTTLQNGTLAPGEFVISDEIYYMIDHENDVSYEEAFSGKNTKNSNMLWGGYAYTEVKDKSFSLADYTVLNDKCIYFKKYVQDLEWNPSENYSSVVPVYSFGMMGNSREFAESTFAFVGMKYESNQDNPFYDATPKKQKMVYNSLMDEYGEELANEYFANYQKILNTPFVVLTYVVPNEEGTGIDSISTYGSTYIADLDDNGDGTLTIVDVLIDPDTFEMKVENPDHWITYDVDMADDFDYYDVSYADGSQIRLYRTSDKYLTGFVGSDAGAYNGIAGFGIADKDYYFPEGYNTEANKSEIDLYTDFSFILMTDGTMAVNPIVTFGEKNTISVSFEEVYNFASNESEERVVNFKARYSLIGCGDTVNGGFALTDSTGTYCYNNTQDSYLRGKLDDEYVDNLDPMDLYAVLTLNSRIAGELVKGFEEEGIVVTVDENNGSIILDNGVLFALDKSDLSADGEKYLTSVGRVFDSVISKGEYAGRIKTIKVDGYADPQGGYEHNKVLSEARAKTVKDYLSNGYPEMTPLLQSEGHSCDNPIIAEDGTVDYDASRRVELSFFVDMDEYIANDAPNVAALYGTFIGEEYGSKLELRSGGRGTFTNSGSTIPMEITWRIEGDIVILEMPMGYLLYSDYDTDTLRFVNDEESRWKPDTFHRVE